VAEVTLTEALGILRDRAGYLKGRIIAKQAVGWEFQYDERERAALELAIVAAERDTSTDAE